MHTLQDRQQTRIMISDGTSVTDRAPTSNSVPHGHKNTHSVHIENVDI